MDFNLFHDCQECLFTMHLHFLFCMFCCFYFYLLFFRIFSICILFFDRKVSQWFDRHYNMYAKCLNSASESSKSNIYKYFDQIKSDMKAGDFQKRFIRECFICIKFNLKNFFLPFHIIADYTFWKWKVKPLLLIVHFAFLDFRFVYINAVNEIKKFLF